MMKMEIQGGGGLDGGGKKWELRPGGMLVQKRTDEEEKRMPPPPPKIRVRVKYGEVYHEIHISPEASFGELKKLLSGPTGLHHQDQKVFYKNKERDSKSFLDTSGVKDKSKLALLEDPISKEKRHLEMKKKSQMEKASNIISHVSLQIDKLVKQVSALESVVSKGEKVVQNDLVRLNDSLMNQLLQLDNIPFDCDAKLQQVKRVQNNVEKLDVLKLKNSSSSTNTQPPLQSNANLPEKQQHQQSKKVTFSFMNQQQETGAAPQPTVVTTKWETFDSSTTAVAPPLIDAPSSSSATRVDHQQMQPGFTWNLL